ncbi:MAG TPA: hypothetical protein VIH89_00925 [Candidatus Sulfotelmatobacter sp.]
MPTQIKFGTSGWRAVIAEELTFGQDGGPPGHVAGRVFAGAQ